MKDQKGVTLIALVVSIIVILVLASVSLKVLTGDNGVITRAKDAQTMQIVAEEKDTLSLAYASAVLKNQGGTVTAEDIQEELEATEGADKTEVTAGSEEKTFVVEFKETNNKYNLNNGTITKVENND